MSPKLGMAEIRQEQVVQAAIKCLVEKGFQDFSVKEIAEEAGVSTGILYHYFENKEDIVVQALKTVFSRTDQKITETVEAATTGLEKLETYLDHAGRVGREDPLSWLVLLNYLGQVKYNQRIGQTVVKFFRNFRGYAYRLMQGVLAEQERTVDPEKLRAAAALAVGASLGLGLQWVVDPQAFDLDAATREMKDVVLKLLSRA